MLRIGRVTLARFVSSYHRFMSAPAAVVATETLTPTLKRRKKKVALLFGYVGAGYQGLQMNPGAHTIEEDLERALHEEGAISDANHGDLKKVCVCVCLCVFPPSVVDSQ
jgi:hypothetical protein